MSTNVLAMHQLTRRTWLQVAAGCGLSFLLPAMNSRAASARGNERKNEITARTQTPHEVRLGRAAEGVREEGAHGRVIAGPLEAQLCR